VILDIRFCPEATEVVWSGLGNQIVQFGGHHELVLAYVLTSIFAFGTLFCSSATSSGSLSVSGIASLLAKDLLPVPAFS
jgi:hypothetical protein